MQPSCAVNVYLPCVGYALEAIPCVADCNNVSGGIDVGCVGGGTMVW